MSVAFRPQNTRNAATKRIIRDLQDLHKNSIPGLSVCCPDESNPFVLHCNVLISDGPYHGIIIHLILHIPDDYPLTGPAGNIAPGLEFDHRYHLHIHDDHINGHALCNDLLTNYAAHFRMVDDGNAKQASGWSPGYTLSTILLQIVTFFADPDFGQDPLPQLVDQLREMVKSFRCITCGHSYENVNPPIVDYTEIQSSPKVDEEQERAQRERDRVHHELVEKLTCGVTKQNVIEDQICLGYPLLIKRDQRSRLSFEIILELISYDAYVAEIQKSGEEKLDFYENHKFRSVTGKDYNHWLPIFVNSEHFERGRTIIENSISIIDRGTALGIHRNDFVPEMALKVLTALMNKTVVQLFNGEMYESKQAIEAYCHFLRLLMHFIDIYPQLDGGINKTIADFISDRRNRQKQYVPDMGEFLIKIALSKKYHFAEIKKYIYEEYFARQIFWIEQKQVVRELLCIKSRHLPDIFQAAQVSNHLLVFNLAMAETFIYPGVKEELDKAFGYPSDQVVEKFQRRLRDIKAINDYRQLMKEIRIDDIIESSEDMVNFLISSVKISNRQGYTNIRPSYEDDHRSQRQTTYDDHYSHHCQKRFKK
ncbi:unnamed protein product [Adineta ricciae]|uniref:UBC core domain-containing protein n=1 Tax=Adineta ricciae TaxID=249248 RepID=A0A814JGP2_ADIRI|nr:unnamed protein product [Adineta ricciae]CAF1037874.1 unnamed protein product [Adineta ricciae]